MYILSFDIGEITLTFCFVHFNVETNEYKIIDWVLTSIRKVKQETSTQKINNLIEFLKLNFSENKYKDIVIDQVLIEHQGNFRPFMKSIQICIYTYFKINNDNIHIVHAINKYKSNLVPDHIKKNIVSNKQYTKSQLYQINKKLSKEFILYLFPELLLNKYIIFKDCIDDYSDAFFQIYVYICNYKK